MQEELNQLKETKFGSWCPSLKNRTVIGTKWVFQEQAWDEADIVTRNKIRLVAKGYSQ